jgi:Kef-type K+ transport system membrane component KefB
MPLGSALQGLTTRAVFIVGALATGNLFGKLGQPKVLGPITLGVAVGAAVTAIPESLAPDLVSASSRSLIEAVGIAGLLLLMFSVGAELRRFGASDQTSFSWRLAPCALAAWPFADRLADPGDTGPYGWLFVGIALGVTAVPVLVILTTDSGLRPPPPRSWVSTPAIGAVIGGFSFPPGSSTPPRNAPSRRWSMCC